MTEDEIVSRITAASSVIGFTWVENDQNIYRNVEYLLERSPSTLDDIVDSCKNSSDDRHVWRGIFTKDDWKSGPQTKIKYEDDDCTPEEQRGGDVVPLLNDYLVLLPITRRVVERAVGNTPGTNPYIVINMDMSSTSILNYGIRRTPENLQAGLLHKFINQSIDPDLIDLIASRLDEVERHLPELRVMENVSAARVEAVLDGVVPAALFDGVL